MHMTNLRDRRARRALQCLLLLAAALLPAFGAPRLRQKEGAPKTPAQQPTPQPAPRKIPPIFIPRPGGPPPPAGGQQLPPAGERGKIDVVLRPGLAGSMWDFERGDLNGWTATGTAFRQQPTYGDNVVATRVNPQLVPLGGDYWKGPYPVGAQGRYWVGTYESRPGPDAGWGQTQGDAPTGALTSDPFVVNRRHLSFLVGGGADVNTVRVELVVAAADFDRLEQERGGASRGPARKTGGLPFVRRDGDVVVVFRAAGQNSELMRRVSWDVSPFAGARARVRIVDESSGGWGHINADDFRFSDEPVPPDAAPPPVWGFADTHTHPSNYLGFGGNLIQGRLYSASGSPGGALPPVFNDRSTLRDLLNLFKFVSAEMNDGGGYPDFSSYPKFDNGIGQQMYTDWIRRAYDGGLRLMSGLAVNNWLISTHHDKHNLFGTTQPVDDRGSADVQIADIKRWAQLPANRDWVEVAYTPEDARRIIGQNKLAVVLGVEVDLLGNFAPNRSWAAPEIRVLNPNPRTPEEEAEVRQALGAELDRLFAAGVRQLTPLHYVSGVFGGTAIFNRFFNEINRKFTGRNYVVESGERYGVRYRLNNDAWGTGGATAREIATGDSRAVAWDRSWEEVPLGHVNSAGLTRTGEILIEEAARRGMLLDTDHASFKTTDAMLDKAEALGYPLMSSHSDYLDLGMTGREGFTHNDVGNDDADNLRRFGTTLHDNLRHEGMGTRSKFERIARLGGTQAPLMSTYRRTAWGKKVPNDSEGSSKTWAQMYQYAVSVSGGRGVALSSDRGFINFIAPRFGPNAAYMLGAETMQDLTHRARGRQVEGQRNGVRYDSPIRDWRAPRFKSSGNSAYEYTGKAFEHEDAWRALAAYKAGRNPWTMGAAAEIPASGAIGHTGRIENFARGFFAESEAQLESDCGLLHANCFGATIAERFAAYYVKAGVDPATLPRWRGDAAVLEHYGWVKRVWDHWHRMEGDNEPLSRYVFGRRDFDINIDGVAHYGMLPDFLQDVRNAGLSAGDLAPLFRSAEDYIQMWEKCESRARAAR